MSKNFIDFVNKRNTIKIIKEAYKNDANFDEFVNKISEMLGKHIKNLYPLVGYIETSSDNKNFLSKQYIVSYSKNDCALFQLNWRLDSKDKELYSIDFFKDIDFAFTGNAKTTLSIYTNGSSIVYFLPVIWNVVNGKNYDLSEKEAIEYGRTVFNKQDIKEYKLNYGTLSYRIITETTDEVDNYMQKKREELDNLRQNIKTSFDTAKWIKLHSEYQAMLKAYMGGNAKNISDLELAIKQGVQVTQSSSPKEQAAQKKIDSETKFEDPAVAFKKMDGYVKMVIDGHNPSVILCGAPGVGKTYRVKKMLKENGYVEDKNMFTIKGKCTPRRLYLALYKYKDKGDILLIDDADVLIGPNAPTECIDILKAALDSTADAEGRRVSYDVNGKLYDDDGNEIPKRFYYNGGVIVITNYHAGSLDTAVRGRSYIQDINFSTESVLKLIKGLLRDLGDGTLSMESKYKAYDYFLELIKEKMEFVVSIRTFIICATLFESIKDDDNLAKAMIKEQMKLQSDRLKNKY